MNIAVVVSTFPPYAGGMGNVAAAHAQALRKAGHEVTVLAPGHGLRPLFRIGNSACVPQLFWKLRGFDVVELHYPFFGGAEWAWLWKKTLGRRKRLAIFYHMDTVGRGVFGAIFRFYRVLLLMPILRSANAVLASSRDYFVSSQASRLFAGEGNAFDRKNEPKAYEVPFGVDTDFFKPGGEKKNAALFVGGLDAAHYFKGVPVLLEAFAKISQQIPRSELWIVGDGDLRATYESLSSKLGLKGRARFLGRLDDQEVADAYRAASVHVLPSVDRSEALGLVTLAAGASGLPSIVSDLPGVRSVIEPGVTGLVVKPSDPSALAAALFQLLSDPVRAESMGRAARERVEHRYASEATERALVRAVCGPQTPSLRSDEIVY